MEYCKIIILSSLLAGFVMTLYRDCNGSKAKEPQGFAGVIGTVIVYAIMAAVYYGAGLFSFGK